MALPEPPRDPDGPTAMVPGPNGQDGSLVSFKIVGNMTQNIFPTQDFGPHRFRRTLPLWHCPTGFGEPLSVVFQILTWDPPPQKFCVN